MLFQPTTTAFLSTGVFLYRLLRWGRGTLWIYGLRCSDESDRISPLTCLKYNPMGQCLRVVTVNPAAIMIKRGRNALIEEAWGRGTGSTSSENRCRRQR